MPFNFPSNIGSAAPWLSAGGGAPSAPSGPSGGGGGGGVRPSGPPEEKKKKGPGVLDWLWSGIGDPFRQKLPSLFYPGKGEGGGEAPPLTGGEMPWWAQQWTQWPRVEGPLNLGQGPIDVTGVNPFGIQPYTGPSPSVTATENLLSPTGYAPNEWVYDEKQGEWGWWEYDVFNDTWAWRGSPSETGEMSDYEMQLLSQRQQESMAERAWQQEQMRWWREQQSSEEAQRLMELATNPRNWILYNTEMGQESTVPSWLSQIYEGGVETGAPLGEAKELGHVPALSRQTYDWLNPTEREQLGGYLSWLGIAPEDWMSNLWWMRGKQPQGARPHEAFRQY